MACYDGSHEPNADGWSTLLELEACDSGHYRQQLYGQLMSNMQRQACTCMKKAMHCLQSSPTSCLECHRSLITAADHTTARWLIELQTSAVQQQCGEFWFPVSIFLCKLLRLLTINWQGHWLAAGKRRVEECMHSSCSCNTERILQGCLLHLK